MRISDWSSDVCSSDLVEPVHLAGLDDHALRRVAGVDQGLVHQLGLLRRRTFVAGAGSQVNGNVDFIRTPHGRRLVPPCLGRPMRPAQATASGLSPWNFAEVHYPLDVVYSHVDDPDRKRGG